MQSRTENMEIDIDAIPKGVDASVEIEFLRRIESWRNTTVGCVKKWNLLRYLVILYSYDSYLNSKNPIPLEERKQRALAFAEIDVNEDITDELVDLRNDLILKMVQDFLIAQRNHLWTEIVTTEQQYEEAVRLRLQPLTTEKDKDTLAAAKLKKDLRLDCKEMQTDLETFYRKFYQDHGDVKEAVRQRATTLEMLSKSTKYDKKA